MVDFGQRLIIFDSVAVTIKMVVTAVEWSSLGRLKNRLLKIDLWPKIDDFQGKSSTGVGFFPT